MTPPNPTNSATSSAAIPLATPAPSSRTESPPPAAGTTAAGSQAGAQPAAQASVVAPQDGDPKRWEWKFSLGIGTEEQGGRNGGVIFPDNISQYGDYIHYRLDGALMRDLLGNKLRFRAGPYLAFDASNGNENTGGSTTRELTGGPRAELDWNRVYNGGLWNVLTGPSRVGIYGGIGYGWGTTNVDGGFQLHKQNGLATALGLDLNLFNFNIGNVAAGVDVFGQQDAIYGSAFNSAGRILGFQVTVRPSTNKVAVPGPEKCDGAKRSIDSYIANIGQLRAENEKVKNDLDQLKTALEGGSDPLTTANIRDALFYREVRRVLVDGGANEQQVRDALKKAYIAKKNKLAEKDIDNAIVSGVKGLKLETLADAKAKAAGKYPEGYDFWAQVTGDPVPTELPPNIKDLDCGEIDKWIERLHQEELDLTKRNRDLKGRFDTAVLVDALKDHLGKNVEKFIEKVHGFTLDILQPNFLLNQPDPTNPKIFDRLEEYVKKNAGKTADPKDPALLAIAKQFFALPDFELENLQDVADKMNGLKNPSASRYDKNDPNEDKTPYEWMKQVTWTVEGHTDLQPFRMRGKDWNPELSENRAKAVKLFLQAFGVDDKRIDTIGYGATRPAVPEKGTVQQIQTAQNKNRRVIIRVKGELPSAPVTTQTGTISVDPNKEAPDRPPTEEEIKRGSTRTPPAARPAAPPPPIRPATPPASGNKTAAPAAPQQPSTGTPRTGSNNNPPSKPSTGAATAKPVTDI